MKRMMIVAAAVLMPQLLQAQDFKRAVIPILIETPQESQVISVKVEPGLRSSKRLPKALRLAREAMQANESVTTEDLRLLAIAGDGLAAQRYVRFLQSRTPSADPSDIAYFSAIAVGTGRVWTIKPMIEAMHQLDPKTEPKERVSKYIRVLYPHAWAGNSVALDALIDFNGEGRLFGPLSAKTRDRILKEVRAQGHGRTELGLALAILEVERASDAPNPDEIARARSFLEHAQGSDHLAIRTTAQNLLRMIESG